MSISLRSSDPGSDITYNDGQQQLEIAIVDPTENNVSGRESGAKSIQKVALVLDCFTRSRRSLTISEISEITKLPQSTIHRIVTSLRDVGMLEQDHRRAKYRLGLRLFYYGSAVLANLDFNQHAHEHVAELSKLSGEVVRLHMFDGSRMVCIEREEIGATRNTALTTIESSPIHCSSVGKAFLAFQEPSLIGQIIETEGLEKRTGNTLHTAEALMENLKLIRERGFALDEEEDTIGVRCVGAPIRDSRGHVFAAISVSGPAERMPEERLVGLAPTVMQTADAISRKLGWEESRTN